MPTGSSSAWWSQPPGGQSWPQDDKDRRAVTDRYPAVRANRRYARGPAHMRFMMLAPGSGCSARPWADGVRSGRRVIHARRRLGREVIRAKTRREDSPPLLADLDCAVRGSDPLLRVCPSPLVTVSLHVTGQRPGAQDLRPDGAGGTAELIRPLCHVCGRGRPPPAGRTGSARPSVRCRSKHLPSRAARVARRPGPRRRF